jgi:hypothetical protein
MSWLKGAFIAVIDKLKHIEHLPRSDETESRKTFRPKSFPEAVPSLETWVADRSAPKLRKQQTTRHRAELVNALRLSRSWLPLAATLKRLRDKVRTFATYAGRSRDAYRNSHKCDRFFLDA